MKDSFSFRWVSFSWFCLWTFGVGSVTARQLVRCVVAYVTVRLIYTLSLSHLCDVFAVLAIRCFRSSRSYWANCAKPPEFREIIELFKSIAISLHDDRDKAVVQTAAMPRREGSSTIEHDDKQRGQ